MSTASDFLTDRTARLHWHVDRLAGLIGPRHLGRPRALEAAATLIERELASAGHAVQRLPYEVASQPVVNLLAEMPGIALPEAVPAIRLSDNSSFWDQGYPALMLTDTSFLRNPHYHLSSDTPETLDYGRMALVTQGVAGAVAHLARATVPRGF
jgi:hypothetical protein